MSDPKHTTGSFSVEDREERIVIFADHFHREPASLSCYAEDAETQEIADALHEEQLANAELFAGAAGMADALEAVLLFYAGGPWDAEKEQRWRLLTGGTDVTTRAMCDCVRARLSAAGRMP